MLLATWPPVTWSWLKRGGVNCCVVRLPSVVLLVLNRLKPNWLSATRSTSANFTCNRICLGSGAGGAFNRLITVLARVCAIPASRLESSALFTDPDSTMVSPEPVTDTLLPLALSSICLRKASHSDVSLPTSTSYCSGSAPSSQMISVVCPGPLALTITSRGEMTIASAIFGSAITTF